MLGHNSFFKAKHNFLKLSLKLFQNDFDLKKLCVGLVLLNAFYWHTSLIRHLVCCYLEGISFPNLNDKLFWATTPTEDTICQPYGVLLLVILAI